jgi:thiol-disulfide isomerase/thioredoxin
MRKLGILLLTVIAFYSCQPEQPADYLTVAGKFKNNKDSVLNITGFGTRKRIKINADGSFKDSLKVIKGNLYNLSGPKNGRSIIYLKNGFDLYLTGDANSFFKTFKYKGNDEGAASNNLMVDRFKFGQTAGNAQGFLSLEKDPFLAKVKYYRDGMDSIAKLYPNADPEMVKNSDENNDKFFTQLESNYDGYREQMILRKKATDALKKGNPAPEFVGFEDYKGGKKSLKDFRGKYVYVDVWATWCRPCIAQFPALKKLEDDYKGKNIEFISISTDDDRRSKTWENANKKWRTMVKNRKLGGTQLWAGKDDAKFSQDYMITTIPRFFLIDPKGNIIDSNAKRPADPNLRKEFDELGI